MKTSGKIAKASRTKSIMPQFTLRQVEKALVVTLAPALAAKGGTVLTFSERSVTGRGLVLRLSNGQEFWCSISGPAY